MRNQPFPTSSSLAQHVLVLLTSHSLTLHLGLFNRQFEFAFGERATAERLSRTLRFSEQVDGLQPLERVHPYGNRSTTVAVPMPPPTHMVISP